MSPKSDRNYLPPPLRDFIWLAASYVGNLSSNKHLRSTALFGSMARDTREHLASLQIGLGIIVLRFQTRGYAVLNICKHRVGGLGPSMRYENSILNSEHKRQIQSTFAPAGWLEGGQNNATLPRNLPHVRECPNTISKPYTRIIAACNCPQDLYSEYKTLGIIPLEV